MTFQLNLIFVEYAEKQNEINLKKIRKIKWKQIQLLIFTLT